MLPTPSGSIIVGQKATSLDDVKDSDTANAPNSDIPEKGLDEIQLFKLMMKKEQGSKTPEKPPPSTGEPVLMGPTLQEIENGLRAKEQLRASPTPHGM